MRVSGVLVGAMRVDPAKFVAPTTFKEIVVWAPTPAPTHIPVSPSLASNTTSALHPQHLCPPHSPSTLRPLLPDKSADAGAQPATEPGAQPGADDYTDSNTFSDGATLSMGRVQL